MTSLILRTLSSDRVAWQQTQWRHNSKSYHVTTSSSPLYRFIARDFIMIIVRNSWLRIPVAVYYTRDRGFKRYCGVGNRKSFGYGSSSFVVFCRYLKKKSRKLSAFSDAILFDFLIFEIFSVLSEIRKMSLFVANPDAISIRFSVRRFGYSIPSTSKIADITESFFLPLSLQFFFGLWFLFGVRSSWTFLYICIPSKLTSHSRIL